ncbi:MAG: 33 kDa chaperonin [Deltaproteobacteria bacterium ADurb.Bin510]|nr:MAG: 33 kDa chaperonin [Deltaproteobacteria bacterium ADurb.Bin510]
MPATSEETLERVIANLRELPSLSSLLNEGRSPAEILELIFAGVPFNELERRELCLSCDCSHERMERALITLGREQATELIEAEEPVEIVCEFCRRSYVFAPGELARLFDEAH